MRVERRPISSTVPKVSPTLRKSPTPTAWSKMKDTPPITFSSVFCAASAMAMPPTPSPARRRRKHQKKENVSPGQYELALEHRIKMILLDLERDNISLSPGCFAIVERHLLPFPGTGELVGSDQDEVIGVGYIHLPGLSS